MMKSFVSSKKRLWLFLFVGLVFAVFHGASSFGEDSLRYNWSTGEQEYAGDDESLRYNWSTGKQEYAGDDESLRYNWSTGEQEYAR